ncbi:FAD-binding oxidoreductase [Janthinobacterium sp. AD80]|uniref:NAD(P)/FAD-dependent oxidoreductase n=1 Tax=Janthinobacterium sp. AD80 TaxID=1528773 RepID=UPI000C863ECB|nr:FAD-binding oxidoreductase [Janthinobacterium sp. AD80]PMQ10085.1 Hydrogen cyanide synthase subunit HcnC [Janthinobacterium sp. AD80]
MQETHYDVAVIGGGMAGAALAANLAGELKVLVLERESQPGYHATGRSAALFSAIYGSAAIRALSRASRAFLFDPPAGFCETPLLTPRGVLYIAHAGQVAALQAFAALPDVAAGTRMVSVEQAMQLSPCLRPGYLAAALYEQDACDMDVHALHQGYLRALRTQGGRVLCDASVSALRRADAAWHITTGAGTFSASTIVNAAGAWVDEVAQLAGAAPIGIMPLKRSACIAELPQGITANLHPEHWPLTIDIGEGFYFKPDAGCLLISPADETPSAPCDAWAEDIDIAIAIERIAEASTLEIRRVKNSWAGLRSFVADRNPVVGFDAQLPGFFWLAALGGYGIQTAPAVGRLAAALLHGKPVPDDMLAFGLDVAQLAPQRRMPRN